MRRIHPYDRSLACRRLSAEDARRGSVPQYKKGEAVDDRLRRGSITKEKAGRRSSVGLLVTGSASGSATPVRRVSAQELYGLSGESLVLKEEKWKREMPLIV